MSSSVGTESIMTCVACGASIYQEHIDRGLAGMWAGQMLCPACLREKKESDQAGEGTDELGSLPLMTDSEPTGVSEAPPINDHSGFSVAEGTGLDGRPVPPSPGRTARGARRVRTFHSKLSEGAVNHLDEQINAWLESHPEIEIKFANTTVGVWEAKHAEPNLIVTIFY